MKFEMITGATNWLHEQFSGSSCGGYSLRSSVRNKMKEPIGLSFHLLRYFEECELIQCTLALNKCSLELEAKDILNG